MSNLILLIHSEADLIALPDAAKRIVDHGYKGVWALFSPAIAVDQAMASAKYDKEIADLQAAEQAAAGRGDYNAASEHQLARRGKELERGTALASSWKSLSEDARKLAYAAKLEPLRVVLSAAKLNVRVDVTQDHYDATSWVALLNSMSGVWFKHFQPGHFSVAWPSAIPALPSAVKIPIVSMECTDPNLALDPSRTPNDGPVEVRVKPVRPAPIVKTKPAPESAATEPDARRKQLLGMRFFALASVAKKLGVEVKGKRGPQIVDEILAKEFAPAQA